MRLTRNYIPPIAGTTTAAATNVTLYPSPGFGARTATIYADATFAFGGWSAPAGSNSITAVAQDSYGRLATNIAILNLPSTNNYTYDANGNLLSDGNCNFAYDDESRLVAVWVTNTWESTFTYDGKFRRRIRREFSWSGGAWLQTNEVHYIYDGSVVVQERDINNLPQVTYTRTGGSLLARTANPQLLNPTTASIAHAYYHADGNANITCLIYTNQQIAARYEYSPFGELLRATGPMAKANPFRFSTEYYDDESDLIMYPYRPYSPSTGRFLSRDPLGAPGFDGNQYFAFSKDDLQYLAALDPGDENLDALETAQNNIFYAAGKMVYVTANNDPVNKTDLYGLVCNTVANRTKAYSSGFINAGHEWIAYDGNSVGFWPNRGYVVLRPDPGQTTPFPIYWQWDTVQKKSGTIKWGSGAGKSCACATCADILASIDAAPNPGWHSFPIRNNCRRFVKWVFAGSCLEKGKKTSLNP